MHVLILLWISRKHDVWTTELRITTFGRSYDLRPTTSACIRTGPKAFKSSEADAISALKARIAAMQKQQQNDNRAKITQLLIVLLILD